jgi:Domain of unknown function (DUF4389)
VGCANAFSLQTRADSNSGRVCAPHRLLAIPHYIVLVFLWIAAVVSVVIAWFAILFTGSYPRGLFDFVLGVFRWTNRVVGYALILVTDEYPPFRLSP